MFLLYEQNGNTPSKETINPDTFKTTDFIKKHNFKEKPVATNGFEVPKSKFVCWYCVSEVCNNRNFYLFEGRILTKMTPKRQKMKKS